MSLSCGVDTSGSVTGGAGGLIAFVVCSLMCMFWGQDFNSLTYSPALTTSYY